MAPVTRATYDVCLLEGCERPCPVGSGWCKPHAGHDWYASFPEPDAWPLSGWVQIECGDCGTPITEANLGHLDGWGRGWWQMRHRLGQLIAHADFGRKSTKCQCHITHTTHTKESS